MSISIETQYKKTISRRSDIERELYSLPLGDISTKVIHEKNKIIYNGAWAREWLANIFLMTRSFR